MKIQIVSDLHDEFGLMKENYKEMIDTPADVLVLAGDISNGQGIIRFLSLLKAQTSKQIIFVPGNHDYYGASRKTLDKEFKRIDGGNLHVLIERDICIGNTVFIGSTGWWDGSGGHLGQQVKMGLNDFRMVYDLMDEGNLDGVAWGRKARTYIEGRLVYYKHNFPDKKRVVVTHHFPHRSSISPQFKDSALNVCFYNSWEHIIQEHRPELWIHGHTHTPWDYKVHSNHGFPHEPRDDKGYTRIVCNPQGYPEKFAAPKDAIAEHYKKYDLVASEADYNIYQTTENPDYDPCKVVEI